MTETATIADALNWADYGIIGILVFLMKPHQRSSWNFFLLTATFGIYITFLYKLGVVKPANLETVNIFAYVFIPAALVNLAFSFPEERKLIKKFPFLQIVPYLFSLILFIGIRLQTSSVTDAPKMWLLLTAGYTAVAEIRPHVG